MSHELKGGMLDKMVEGIIDKSLPLISNLSNVSAVLNTIENINWCGFYLFDGNDTLYLGPFQGEVACTLIPLSKGVCGYAASIKQTVIVDNVNEFKGHIACSSKSKSEIVVPILRGDELLGVIDIDSPIYSRFNEQDKEVLEKVAKILVEIF